VTAINCDMGEAFGLYRMGDDEALIAADFGRQCACGFHASDFNHMRKTVLLAKQHKVGVGPPSFAPDLQGFGRRDMKMFARRTGQLHHLPGRRASKASSRPRTCRSTTSNPTARSITWRRDGRRGPCGLRCG